MHVSLTEFHDSAACMWCERTKEALTVEFADGFLKNAVLCWRCLAKAVRIRERQTSRQPETDGASRS